MQIGYKTKKLKRICTKYAIANKEYGPEMAIKIHQRVNEIEAVDTVHTLVQFRIGRCHALKGRREGEYAVDLVHPFRLIFTVKKDKMMIARIEEIVDYH
ncbi:proteic killer suppression protein [Peptoniphilus ivorii]|uniref:type II toxin-antitoxin system RelE/ParE family toxin n=1 Tax=Aedoeadaptatus ivorii TaxID=54006 RepID=UPI000F81B0F7|nr:type II toxin-antitoxin system RelE/ParE family toxin [Peptoniphilus ivorii]MDQ0507636.1 proteic killer suppression protein [Peptoniphilus ivorii]